MQSSFCRKPVAQISHTVILDVRHKMTKEEQTDMTEGRLLALCLILSLAIFLFDTSIPLGVAGGVPYILVVLVSICSKHRRLTYYVAIAASILTIAGFYSSPAGGELWKVLSNRALALFAIWVTAALSLQRRTAQEEQLRAISELNTLQGMLPICSACKKIRDDKGSWHGVEDYVQQHAEVSFTHGVCPDCLQKTFPDEKLDLDEIYGASPDQQEEAPKEGKADL